MKPIDETRETLLKSLLLAEKRRLWNELRVELFDKLDEGLHSQYDIPLDIGEKGILTLLEDTGLAVIDIRRKQLVKMEEAFLKHESGSYGICEDCGKEIDGARLEVEPYAICCVSCQKYREGPASLPGVTL